MYEIISSVMIRRLLSELKYGPIVVTDDFLHENQNGSLKYIYLQ
jgi:hypothetical protein